MKRFLSSLTATLVASALILLLFNWGSASLDNLVYYGSMLLAGAVIDAWVVIMVLIRRRWA